MCRLTAVTATNVREELRLMMFDRMMLAANADEAQNDGHGIATQSGIIWKSQHPYYSTDPDYLDNLESRTADQIIIGHVRKASVGTDKYNALAAHPYIFYIDDRPLILAHNGFIEGTPRGTYSASEPNTDTFRAGKVLVSMFQAHVGLTGSYELTDELLEAWMQTFYKASVYVIFLLWNDELIILRGNAHRTMYLNKVGNGYIFNTSRDVVEVTSTRFKQLGVETGEVLHYLAEFTITRCRAGDSLLHIKSYTPDYDDWPKYVPKSHAASGGGAKPPTYNPAPVANNVIALPGPDDFGDSALEEFYLPHKGQKPRRSVEDKSRAAVMTQIRADLNPMRSSTIFYWIAEMFGLKGDKGIRYEAVLDLPVTDLQDFIEYMAPAMTRNQEDPTKMFSSKQKSLINMWNRLVPVERDQEMLSRFTKSWDYFWIKTDVELPVFEAYLRSLLDSKPTDTDPFLVDQTVAPATA